MERCGPAKPVLVWVLSGSLLLHYLNINLKTTLKINRQALSAYNNLQIYIFICIYIHTHMCVYISIYLLIKIIYLRKTLWTLAFFFNLLFINSEFWKMFRRPTLERSRNSYVECFIKLSPSAPTPPLPRPYAAVFLCSSRQAYSSAFNNHSRSPISNKNSWSDLWIHSSFPPLFWWLFWWVITVVGGEGAAAMRKGS